MIHTIQSLSLKGKKIVSITNGEVIGEVADVIIDIAQRQVAGLLVSKGSLFHRETEMIPRSQIPVLGKDVVLASGPDVMVKRETVQESGQWIQLSDQMKGNDVITSDGTRVGKLLDMIIDETGQVVAIALAGPALGAQNTEPKQIPARSLISFGRDALIVDPAVIDEMDKEARGKEEVETAGEPYPRQETDDLMDSPGGRQPLPYDEPVAPEPPMVNDPGREQDGPWLKRPFGDDDIDSR